MKQKSRIATIQYAFKKSLPVLFGYLFLGSAFGIMLYNAGYNWVWAACISLVVFAGSGQFLLVSLLTSAASIPTVAVMTLFINSRHMFYGLSLIDKFKAGGWRYPFMIFTLTDETYSVNVSIQSVPDRVDEPKARFLIGELDHHSAGEIRVKIDAAVSCKKPNHLILDFKNVSFMDSSGIGLVMGRYRMMQNHHGSVEIRNVTPQTKKIMELAGLGRIAIINEIKENKGE